MSLCLPLLALCLAALAVCAASFLSGLRRKSPAGPGAETAAGDRPLAVTPDLAETPDAGLAYQDRLVFAGDARTARMRRLGVLSGGTRTRQVWTPETGLFNLNAEAASQRITLPETGESLTLAEAAARVRPAFLVLTIGADWGVPYLSETEFKTCYADLVRTVQAASPETRIILQSLFPEAGENGRLEAANRWIRAVAAETGCRYADAPSVLKDEAGRLRKEYDAGGGRLTAEAYRAVLAYLRAHACP